MEWKNISRQIANGLLWTKIFEVPRPVGVWVCYICIDDAVEFVLWNIGANFVINRWKKNKKWTVSALSWIKVNNSSASVNSDTKKNVDIWQAILDKYK